MKISKPLVWNYRPQKMTQRYQKFVGLKNLGNICYMNSILQQFFMIPAFRYHILAMEINNSATEARFAGQTLKDCLLTQTQRLIANLEVSQREYVEPNEFCYSFKDLSDGQYSINVGQQQDSREFLERYLERMEEKLKNTSRKNLKIILINFEAS